LDNKEIKDGKDAWFYRCISVYIEWSYFNPRGSDADIGFLKVVVPEPSECRELPGTTRISLPSAELSYGSDAGQCPSGSGGFSNGCFASITPSAIPGARALIPETIENPKTLDVEDADFRRLEEMHENLKPMLKRCEGKSKKTGCKRVLMAMQ
jgi:hypothetical protein